LNLQRLWKKRARKVNERGNNRGGWTFSGKKMGGEVLTLEGKTSAENSNKKTSGYTIPNATTKKERS